MAEDLEQWNSRVNTMAEEDPDARLHHSTYTHRTPPQSPGRTESKYHKLDQVRHHLELEHPGVKMEGSLDLLGKLLEGNIEEMALEVKEQAEVRAEENERHQQEIASYKKQLILKDSTIA
jgi:hypothetical protein